MEEEICISPAGKYYLKTLIHRVDYLYFMKDDIDWPHPIEKIDFACAKTKFSNGKVKRYRDTLKALKLLLTHEIKMVDSIIHQNEADRSQTNLLTIYKMKFSPYAVDHEARTIFFSKWMYRSFLKYIASRTDKKYVEKLTNEIEDLLKNNNDLELRFK